MNINWVMSEHLVCLSDNNDDWLVSKTHHRKQNDWLYKKHISIIYYLLSFIYYLPLVDLCKVHKADDLLYTARSDLPSPAVFLFLSAPTRAPCIMVCFHARSSTPATLFLNFHSVQHYLFTIVALNHQNIINATESNSGQLTQCTQLTQQSNKQCTTVAQTKVTIHVGAHPSPYRTIHLF